VLQRLQPFLGLAVAPARCLARAPEVVGFLFEQRQSFAQSTDPGSRREQRLADLVPGLQQLAPAGFQAHRVQAEHPDEEGAVGPGQERS
jgi:hypothetical protein